MVITANGQRHECKEGLTVQELLVELRVETPEYVTVQLNDEILFTDAFTQTVVKDGDVLEFLYFMGGGSR